MAADRDYRPHPSVTVGPTVLEEELLGQGFDRDLIARLSGVLDYHIGSLQREGDSQKWAFHVDPDVRRFHSVESLDDYVATVRDWLYPSVIAGTPTPRSIFVLMPFDERQAAVYAAVQDAVAAAGMYACSRADEITTPGRISLQIIEAIQSSDLIVADLEGHNPNVMYELGFAHAAGRPTILLAPTGYVSPFDIHDWRYIEYSYSSLSKLTEKLGAWLRDPSILAT